MSSSSGSSRHRDPTRVSCMSCIGRHIFFFFFNQSHQGNPFRRVGDVKPADIDRYRAIPGLGRSLKEGMATHSSILAWGILRTEKPSKLQSMGSQIAGHK